MPVQAANVQDVAPILSHEVSVGVIAMDDGRCCTRRMSTASSILKQMPFCAIQIKNPCRREARGASLGSS
uniref:Uncharacterized protein n=1 Tax=Arundo donax TaxID=35708 RepID=A0A0A9G7J5_ARUDO